MHLTGLSFHFYHSELRSITEGSGLEIVDLFFKPGMQIWPLAEAQGHDFGILTLQLQQKGFFGACTSSSRLGMEQGAEGTVWVGVWIENSPAAACERGGSPKPFHWEMRFFQLIHAPGASPFLVVAAAKPAEAAHTNAQWSSLESPNRL